MTLIIVSFFLSFVLKKFRFPGKAMKPFVSAEFSRKLKKSMAKVDSAGVSLEGEHPKARMMFSPGSISSDEG